MSEGQRQFQQPAPTVEPRVAVPVIEQLLRFDGPTEQFLANLLRLQCEAAPAESGAMLRGAPEGVVQAVAIYPPPQDRTKPPEWLKACAEAAPQVMKSGVTGVVALRDPGDLYGQPARHQGVIVPLGPPGSGAVAAFVVDSVAAGEFGRRRERLELTGVLLSVYETRVRDRDRGRDLERLRAAMETLAAVNQSERFAGVAMGLCNEVASRWRCDRVGLGFLKGRYVKLKALSHTEKFSRKMKLVQDIESTMEECVDQDVEVVHPSTPESTFVSRAARELSTRHGPTAVLSLPLRRKGEPVAVLTLERAVDEPFTPDEIEALRLACDLVTARVIALEEHDKWVGARMAGATRKGLGWVVGSKHTWAKLIALLVMGAIVFLIFAQGMYRVEAPFTIEAVEQQVIPAPFDGFLKSVEVEPGSVVEANKTLLATLDTAPLRLELASNQGELTGYLKQVSAAMRDGKTVDAQIAEAQADKTRAQIRLLEYQIGQGTLISPLGGTVVKGDLKRQIGAPVKKGDILFEVAPLDALRGVLSVPEDEIADVIDADRKARSRGEQAKGQLATARHPDVHLDFVVERINPVAEVVSDKNVFKVRVKLLDTKDAAWLQPGMEGAAKIDIDRHHYAWIWSRRLVDWVRMKLWM